MPESLSALLRMVSFTAAKTSRMLEVSVACVKLTRRKYMWWATWLRATYCG